MESGGLKTCRYCEHLGSRFCPFETGNGVVSRTADDISCGQFAFVKDFAETKTRMNLGKLKEPTKPLKRNIEF